MSTSERPSRNSKKGKVRRDSVDKGKDGGEYSGETNKQGKRDGKGTCRFSHGAVYEGEWKDGKMHGKGVYRLADGDVYEGSWTAGVKQGPMTMWYGSGRVDVVSFEKDADESEGVRWSADREMAWRLHKGEVVEEITTEEAQKIASRLGRSVPPQNSSDSPLLRATGATFPGGAGGPDAELSALNE